VCDAARPVVAYLASFGEASPLTPLSEIPLAFLRVE
jgi:hypothetical protein